MNKKRTHNIPRAALTLLLMLTMALTASATDFITDVAVLGHSNSLQLQALELTQYSTQGYTVINHNLNAGCTSGDYIHLLYRKQSSQNSSGAPITGFYILAGNSSNAPDQLTHEGRTYTIAPYDGSTNFINSKGDLNRGAGGAYIHLYYTKDPMPTHHSVTGITFNSTQSGGVGANGDNTTGYDLNSGAGGDYIYMHVTTQLNPNVVMLSSSSGEILLHDGEILTGTGGTETHVSIADGATVTLSGATITSIPNDEYHIWPGLSCLGDAVIVLDEGTTNAIKGGYNHPGIHVPQNHTLTLQGDGTVTSTGGYRAAGIGSGRNYSSCGNITISGGNITAYGDGQAAGIGSGYYFSSCGDITINGGTVTATGGIYAAGIGSGYNQSSCGDITITNGVTRVTATKGDFTYNAIGAGDYNSTCGTITIGGVVTGDIAQSPFVTFPYTVSFNANGGEGTMSDQGFMYNVAQNLNANTFTNGLHPIFGWATSANGPKVYDDGQSVSNLADTIATVNLYAKWRMHYVMLASSTGEVLLQDGDTLTGTGDGNTRVSIADGATVTLSGANITNIAFNCFWPGLSCLGDAVIVLAEGTTNAITGGAQRPGIHVPQGHTLTIQGSGTLNATGDTYSAGIGSNAVSGSTTCGNITINGGTVIAHGGEYGAGIGSGGGASCGNITISGGTVIAHGGGFAAGIGSGDNHSSCGNITINGGTVTATGGIYAAGIGSGYNQSSCGDITITNGVTRVTATKGDFAYNAIGAGGYNSTCGTITIGGVVTGNISQSPFTTFPYTVSFNPNGGEGTMSDQSFMYNVAQNLNANTFTNGLHPIFGWATSANGPKVYDDGQSVSNLADTIATVTLYAKWGNPTFTLDIEGYGDASNPGGWYLIASPVAQAIAPSADNGFITSEYDLYAFDHDYVGEQWRNYETDNFLLTNGMGYLYASEVATTLTFTGTPYNGDGEIELAYNPDVSVFNGWNLVGNPYAQTASVDRDFYVMNGDRSEVIAAEGSTVEPMEGLFVVAEGADETVTFTKNTRETRHEERIVINLSRPSTGSGTGVSTGSTSGVIDRAIVRFGDPSTSSGTGKPFPKFQMNPSHTKVYIPQDGKDYAIVSVSAGRDGVHTVSTMPVNFKAEHNGTYTLTFSIDNVDFDYLHLIDNLTGADVDLLAAKVPEPVEGPTLYDVVSTGSTTSYTFTAKTTDYESRFKLVFNTDNEDGPSTGSGAFAYIHNGDIIVNGEGMLQVIDVTGRVIRSGDAMNRVSTGGMTAGVYVLRLINGNDVKTQKFVID